MNGLYNMNNSIVRLRGLPWNTSESDVQNFLQGCKIRQIQLLTNEYGRATGECFVILESKEDVDIAKNYDKKMMGTRYIEVFESNYDLMTEMMNSNNTDTNDSSNPPNNPSNTLNNDNWREPVVRLRGLPYNSSKNDIIKFFDGIYIEVFRSGYAEARASIMADTQSMARQKGKNGPQRQGNYTNNSDNMNSGSGYNNNMNQYNNGPPPSNNYDTYSGTGNNYPVNNNESGSLKRPMSVSFTMKMRGVPYEAGEKEIYDFFNPVVPIRLEQENTSRGKPPIWYAEFGSREEATEAMTFHKKYMGTRYIELLPLYDDINRSKMVRS